MAVKKQHVNVLPVAKLPVHQVLTTATHVARTATYSGIVEMLVLSISMTGRLGLAITGVLVVFILRRYDREPLE